MRKPGGFGPRLPIAMLVVAVLTLYVNVWGPQRLKSAFQFSWRSLAIAEFVVGAILLFLWFHLRNKAAALPVNEEWQNSESVTLCHEHRRNTKANDLLDGALRSQDEVYLLTIKSRNLFSILTDALKKQPSPQVDLRVLTWFPGEPIDGTNPAIKALWKLTPEDPQKGLDDFAKEVKDAPGSWLKLKKLYPDNLTLHRYSFTPTLEGVLVKDQWAIIEMMPFGVPTVKRAALILRADSDSRSFAYFQNSILRIWEKASEEITASEPQDTRAGTAA